MYVTNAGVLVESQEDRFPRGFHSPDEEKPKKPKLKPYLQCPKCGSIELSTNCKHRDDRSMTELVECENCGHSWKERYELKLVELVEDPDKED